MKVLAELGSGGDEMGVGGRVVWERGCVEEIIELL